MPTSSTSNPGIALAILIALGGCSDGRSLEIRQISVVQAIAVSKIVLPNERMKVPLVMVFDKSGKLVKSVAGWDGNASTKLVRDSLSLEGDGPVLPKVLAAMGQSDAKHDIPLVLALSLGARCPPCVTMEKDLAAVAHDETDAQFTVFLAGGPQ